MGGSQTLASLGRLQYNAQQGPGKLHVAEEDGFCRRIRVDRLFYG